MPEKITVQALDGQYNIQGITIDDIKGATVHDNGALSVRTPTSMVVFAPGFWVRSEAVEYA